MRFPREANQISAPVHDAFAEVLRGDVDFLQYLPGFEPYLANARVLLETGALVQIAVQIKEPLGEGLRVMGIGMDCFNVVNRHFRACSGSASEDAQDQRDPNSHAM